MQYAITIQGYKAGKPNYMVERLIGTFDSVDFAFSHIHSKYPSVKAISSIYHIYVVESENICLQILELKQVDARRIVTMGPYQTYKSWQTTAKKYGGVRLEGDKDIAQIFDARGKAMAEWDGVEGFVFISKSL